MLIKSIIGGFFLFNGIPHLVKGIVGEVHMTPFKRKSSPFLNIVWSFVNFVGGLLVLGYGGFTAKVSLVVDNNMWAFLLGGFMLSLTAAWLFGRPDARLPWHKD